MEEPRRVEIVKQTRLFEDFFKVDEVVVAHERRDGKMSPPERRLIFERGDSVAVLLLDLAAKSVVLTSQFRIPALVGRRRTDPASADGWITEAVAGMIEPNEKAESAAIRETMEETGCRIRNPTLIARFFSSPGGASERVFLYFAQVRGADNLGGAGGVDDEDVEVVRMTLHELFDRVDNHSIEDPKLLIAAYWLQAHLPALQARELLIEGLQQRVHPTATASEAASGPLPPSTRRYAIKGREDLIVGYKTGPIDGITGVSIWVNSENTDMMMDRFIGKTISAKIRLLGANKDESGNVVEDTIADELRSAVGLRGHVKIGTVLSTRSGMLRSTHQVRQVLHVASVEGGPGEGVRADPAKLKECVKGVLARAERENNRLWKILLRTWRHPSDLDSILVPMIGCGDGGLPVEEAAQTIIGAAVEHISSVQFPTLKDIYFLAYRAADRNACEQALRNLCEEGALVRPERS
ncbi:MAG: NUDIX domain-containing protein [Bradyrhizobium sp.]|nr:MAG: NUDIX domain-containing protein [Bradyrhizobium sp.]